MGGELEGRIVGVISIIRKNLSERLELYKRMKIERRINSLEEILIKKCEVRKGNIDENTFVMRGL